LESLLTIDEIKKGIQAEKNRIQAEKNRLKSNFKNPLDKITSIDDLLRETIASLKDLTQEQEVTNKILIAMYIQEGADGSMTAKPIAGVDTESILAGLRGGDDYQTLNPILNNVAINGNEQIINIEGSGIIDVIKFVSSTSTANNKSYSVRITCDKSILYANTWTELASRTPNERGMVCYEDIINLEYILMFKLIAYSDNFKIDVYDCNNAKFSMIQIKYHKKM